MKDMKIIHYLVCITLAVLVHIVYQAIIIPESLAIMSTAESNGQTLPRHFLIIIKDLEQEICVILLLIGLYLMTYKIFQLDYLFAKIFVITKYFLITFIKYPIWMLIIVSSVILHMHYNYFKNNKFILSYILSFFGFIYAVFINQPADFYNLIPLTLDRILFAISGFLIFLNIELFNKIKSK